MRRIFVADQKEDNLMSLPKSGTMRIRTELAVIERKIKGKKRRPNRKIQGSQAFRDTDSKLVCARGAMV